MARIRITHFMRRPRPNLFSLEQLHEDIRDSIAPECEMQVWVCRNFSNGLWPRAQDVWLARKAQGDVNHVTGDVHYLTFLLNPNRTILTVHDLVGLHRLSGIKRFVFWFFWYWLPLKRCRTVVTISESTRRQLIESVRCDPSKVRVIHNNVSDDFRPADFVFRADRPHILQIGTTPNKNIERVAEALSGLGVHLVIVGPISEPQKIALGRYGIDYENHVGLSREEIVWHYQYCDMLIFVSTYEGFGLPIVEAQAVGRPVVTSNILSMPEVAGSGACLVDPFDPVSIRTGVLRVINDDHYRNELVAEGRVNVARFRTEIVADAYAALYREVAGDGGRRDPLIT